MPRLRQDDGASTIPQETSVLGVRALSQLHRNTQPLTLSSAPPSTIHEPVIGHGERARALQKITCVNTAWSYLVVSSDKQSDTLVDQEAWARSIAAAHGWTIERTFSDTTSGKRGVRKLLVQLVAELRATPREQRPARVLMLRLDRIGRGSIVESQVALREISQLGVIVHTRDGGDQRLDGAMDELIAAAKFAVASFENDTRREKSLAFQARKRAAGEWGSAVPYGFVLVDKRLAPYEPEAAIVRELFERRVAGWGYSRLAAFISAIAPGKLRPNGQLRAMTWSTSTITTILRRTSYRGMIVSHELWDAAAATRGHLVDRKAPRWPWPLRGCLRCTCGALLVGEASGRNPPKGYRTRYYVCRRITQHGGKYPHHNAERMEAQFLELLRRIEVSPDLHFEGTDPAMIERLRGKRGELCRAIAEIERRRTRAWELAEDGALGSADLQARLAQLASEEAEGAEALREADRALAAAVNRERSAASIAEALAGAAELWPRLDVVSQRSIAAALSQYVGGFFADPGRPGIVLLRESYDSAQGVDTLRNVDMAQRKADDAITKKFIQSITE